MSNLRTSNELSYLYNAASVCRDTKSGYDGMWQVAPLHATIPYSTGAISALEALESELAAEFPEMAKFGRERARKAYGRTADTITKPSYRGRILNFCRRDINQIDNIVRIAAKEPASGGLCFSVFDPNDLLARQRPGFVPCLVAGSVLLHEDELQFNAFFRSQSIVEFAIYDLLHLRKLQIEILTRLKRQGTLKEQVRPGTMNMSMARVFIHRRMVKRKNGSFVRRDEILDRWMSTVYRHMMKFEIQN